MFSRVGLSVILKLIVPALLLAPSLAVAGPPGLPDTRISAEYLANIYEVDGLSTRWINSQPNPVPAKTNPNAAEQLVSEFTEPGFLNLKARSGLSSGLGVRAQADLPPIDPFGDTFLIRSNGISRSSMIRHFTAQSPDGSDLQLGLQMLGTGRMGYRMVDTPGDPFAFERLLDAGVLLEVKLHRIGQAPEVIWVAGAHLIKSEEVDLPFAPYGDAPSWAWTESGNAGDRRVELTLLETYENLFTVADGESFALEFSTEGTALNYEHPNWQAYSEFYGTFSFFSLVSWPPLGELAEQDFLGKFLGLGLDYIEGEFKQGSPSGILPIKVQKREFRPSSFAPYIEDQWDDTLLHTNGTVDRSLRTVAGMAPLSGYGQIGARARLLVQPDNNAQAEILPRSFSRAEYGLSFVPVFDLDEPDQFDLDFDLRLDGVLSVEALDAAAFAALSSIPVAENSHAGVYLEARLEINSTPKRSVLLLRSAIGFNGHSADSEFVEGDLVRLQDYFTFEPMPEAGPQTGGRLRIDINTQSLPPDDSLVSSLQNVATIEPGDTVKIVMKLVTSVRLESADVSRVTRLESDFLDTLSPELSSDTPGVRFELLDLGVFKDGFE